MAPGSALVITVTGTLTAKPSAKLQLKKSQHSFIRWMLITLTTFPGTMPIDDKILTLKSKDYLREIAGAKTHLVSIGKNNNRMECECVRFYDKSSFYTVFLILIASIVIICMCGKLNFFNCWMIFTSPKVYGNQLASSVRMEM